MEFNISIKARHRMYGISGVSGCQGSELDNPLIL